MVRKATPLLNALIERLREATVAFGEKSRLARDLGVAPQQLNAWLAGESEPGGEATLAMLKWVEASERKTKCPAGARTPTGQGTRQKPSANEKKPSGPKGKR